MTIFKYIVSTRDGKTKDGEIEAKDKEEAVEKLLTQDFLIISLKEKKRRPFLLSFTLGKVSSLEKIYLIKNLSLMIKAGLPISEIIETLKGMAKTKKLKKILEETKERVEKGSSLSKALSLYPETFSPLFLGLIRLGEESGQLGETTEHLHSLFLSQYEFKKTIKSALIYPFIIIFTSLAVFFSISLFLLPKLSKLFTTLGVKLPLITRILIFTMAFFQKNLFFIFLAFISLFFLYLILSKNKKIRKFFQNLDLSLPIIGIILRNINIAYFAKNLSLLLKSGMPIERALLLSLEITENEVYKEKIEKILNEVRKGKTIASSLEEFPREFPKIFLKTIESGERTGNLVEALNYLSLFYQAETEREIKDLSIAFEPLLLIIVGLIVAFIAVAVISPIYQYLSLIEKLR